MGILSLYGYLLVTCFLEVLKTHRIYFFLYSSNSSHLQNLPKSCQNIVVPHSLALLICILYFMRMSYHLILFKNVVYWFFFNLSLLLFNNKHLGTFQKACHAYLTQATSLLFTSFYYWFSSSTLQISFPTTLPGLFTLLRESFDGENS